MNAWLITWEWLKEPPTPVEKIVAIISARRSRKFMCDLMELFVLRTNSNADEMAYYANRKKLLVCKAQCYGNYITCGFVSGHGPWLQGRQVTELEICVDDIANDEIIAWREPQEIILRGDQSFEISLGGLKRYCRPKRND